MGKKKGGASGDAKMTFLGRPSNNVKIGIVGLPNVGKSSFFNLLCKMDVPAENFPFCTIEPSISRVPVPDKRWRRLCKDFKPKKEIPAVLTVTDIAGLVKGASEGTIPLPLSLSLSLVFRASAQFNTSSAHSHNHRNH